MSHHTVWIGMLLFVCGFLCVTGQQQGPAIRHPPVLHHHDPTEEVVNNNNKLIKQLSCRSNCSMFMFLGIKHKF